MTRLIAKILKLQVFSSDCFPNQWSDIITSPPPYITLMAKNRKKVMGTGTSDPTPLLEEVGTPTSGNPPVCSIAEEFKSDDEVKVSTETKDAGVTEEVYIFMENRTNFDRELLGS